MPAKTWAGSYTIGSKTWNLNTNWSPSGIPQAGDDVTVAGNTTTTGFVDFSMVAGTSADILAIASLTIGDTTPAVQATYTLTSGGNAAVGWAFGSGSVDLTANGGPVGLGCKMQGSGTIVKKGTGDVYAFGAWSNLATWTGPIDLQAGQLGVDSFDNKLGAGKISMAAGTGLYNLAATTRQIANAVDVNGSVDLNKYASRGQLTINGTVTIANTSGITVTNTSAVALAAATALSAPAGFTRAGSASFTVSGTFNSGALFTNSGSGTVTLSGGTVTLTGGVAHSGTGALTFSGSNIDIGSTFTTSGSAGNVILGTGTGITLNAVAHGGAGTLTFSGTDVTLNGTLTTSGTAGAVTFSGTRFTLNNGFTHGSSNTLSFTGTKSTAGSTGAATINTGSGIVYIGAAATGDANQLAGMTSFAVNGPAGRLAYRGANTYAETATFTGTGIVESHNASSAGINLTGATLTDFTGTVRCYLGSAVATSVQTLGSLNAAATLGVFSEADGSGAREATQKFPNSGTYANPISIANAYTTGITYTIQANNTSAATTFSGAITKTIVAAAPATLALGGVSSQATASGIISSAGGTLNVSVVGGAAWTLSGDNTYGGTTTITSGTLRAASNTAFGAQGGGVILASGQRLELIGGITLNKATADTALQGGTVYNVSGANTYNGATSPLTGAATTFEVAAGSLTWKPLISGAFGLTIKGPGSFKLDNIDSTYTGVTSVTTACTLEVTKLANVDVASSLGKPLLANANIKFVAGSTLLHTGTTADSTDRNIELTTAGTLTIDSSGTGSGAVTLASGGAFVLPAGANALVFTGTNSASNTCARTIANSTSATSLTKNGTNTWSLSGTLTHTGTTTLTAGVLDLGSTPRTGLSTAFIISGGTLQNGTDSVGTTQIIAIGGTIKAKLEGTTALTINSGSTVRMEPNVPTTGSNAQTGAIAVTTGAVVDLVGPNDVNVATIGSGKMLGNGAVTCAGTIRTKHSSTSTQRGQARYKSLTLTAGARLEIGAVAA